MGMGYGKIIEAPISLRQSEFASPIIKQNNKNKIAEVLRIIFTITEIGVAFIPGIGVIAETGINLGFGIANQILDKQTGNVSVVGSLLNFGTPLLGGAFAGVRNVRRVNKLATNLAEQAKLINPSKEALKEAMERVGNFELKLTNSKTGQIITGKYKDLGKDFVRQKALEIGGSLEKSVVSQGASSLSSFSKFNKGPEAIQSLINKHIVGSEAKALLKSTVDKGLKAGDNIAREVGEDVRFKDFLNRIGLTKLEQAELKALLKEAKTEAEFYSLVNGFFRNLSPQRAAQLAINMNTQANVLLNQSWSIPLAREWRQTFDNIKVGLNARQQFIKQNESRLTKFVRSVGSQKFNDRYVQKIQMYFDDNDLGRAGVEHLYQVIKKQIGKYFKNAKKLLEGAASIEEAYIKSGGHALDSTWVLGYKVLRKVGYENIIMVSFRNGKEPIFTHVSDKKLISWKNAPSIGRFYLDNFAFSRGGKSLGLKSLLAGGNIKAASTIGRGILSFIKVGALKNVISIVSNVVENTITYDKETHKLGMKAPGGLLGLATGGFDMNAFTKSLRNSAISRTFRLAGNVIGGGVAGHFFGKKVGDFVGRELQRIGTQILATGVKNKIAGLNFDGSGFTIDKRGVRHYHKSTLKKNLVRGALVSVRSHSKASLRRYKPNAVINHTISARRKLQVVKRIPNAIAPGRPFKGFKIK